MAQRIIKDSIWRSKKLAACSVNAQLHYPRLYLLIDDWSCLEIDLDVIRGLVYPKIPVIQAEHIGVIFKEYEMKGLLFMWDNEGAKYGYFTGKEEGRLDAPSRRRARKTPVPPEKELKDYIKKFNANYEEATEDLGLGTEGYIRPTDCPQKNGSCLSFSCPYPYPCPYKRRAPLKKPTDEEIISEFNDLWKIWPIKKDGTQSLQNYRSLRKNYSVEEIEKAVKGYKGFLKSQRIHKKFNQTAMYLSKFLNKDRWKEYLEEKYVPSL